ncbi:ATP synthase subunit gamma, mitochondrial-like [Cephus cinctus]|uniref:ATP synthase subunit gamma n=1 Tax=Cephus cinctus TaxID=211228 RepID=A0AAJ7BGW6_CEPCN|nr:ATP synthase subunit gamma, mitochondrial-like [Cephus cinctus]
MVSLKVIKNRIRTVSNTKKITQTMRLVSAAKYSRAERELSSARPIGRGATEFFELAGIHTPAKVDPQLIVALTGDRGLCGGIHSGIAKAIDLSLKSNSALQSETKIICVGEKNRMILSRMYPNNIIWVANNVGKTSMTFHDAGAIGEQIKNSIDEYNIARTAIYYNKFVNASSYMVSTSRFYDRSSLYAAEKFLLYDMIEEEIVDCWLEFAIVAIVFWILKESSASEHSARMTSMESATKNAAEMIQQLTLAYNRTRQTVITNELIEIISGASAINKN